jgi:hypothetical protein
MAGVGRKGASPGTCSMCRLKLQEPLKVQAIEHRLALGEGIRKIATEYHIDRFRLSRHWKNHCDQKAILRRIHRLDRDIAAEELLARATQEGTAPLVICDRQIAAYAAEFEAERGAGRREARDAADRRLFAWTHLKHRILTPLTHQYGPQVNVQNNLVVAGAADFDQLVQRMEARLAGRPSAERRALIALLREEAAVEMIDDAAE